MSRNGFIHFLVITFQELGKRYKDKRTDREVLLEKKLVFAKEKEQFFKKRIRALEKENVKLKKREAKQLKTGTSKHRHQETFNFDSVGSSRRPISSEVPKDGMNIQSPRENKELSRKSQPQENDADFESAEGSETVEDTKGDYDEESDDGNSDNSVNSVM